MEEREGLELGGGSRRNEMEEGEGGIRVRVMHPILHRAIKYGKRSNT